MAIQRATTHSVESTNLADLIERVLDKGVVIAGDIKIKLVEVELLTLEIRLVICSVDKAKEIGIDWWKNNPAFKAQSDTSSDDPLRRLEQRLNRLEASLPDPSE
ncbi:MAG: gas vesicle protein [Desulfarculaceae bacterium]|nr:gas vesicle protein [Desulfarculaceae bacterium]MCF8049471.1 gas vesicle protein [Desulfarculaceae bacterium]MCF8064145.1 gas vesicle protein [Desulfarculaceae bacterium]MCF8097139.1 gas vesicle protein [Desulfarculaceae bacterium]